MPLAASPDVIKKDLEIRSRSPYIYLEVVGMKFPIALSIIIYFEIAFTLGGGMLFLFVIVYVEQSRKQVRTFVVLIWRISFRSYKMIIPSRYAAAGQLSSNFYTFSKIKVAVFVYLFYY